MKWFNGWGLGKVLWMIARSVILIGLMFIIVYPFLLKIIDSFKSFEDYIDPTVRYIPKHFTLDNIKTVLIQLNYKSTYITTFAYSTLIAVIQVAISAIVGYGLARFKFKGNKIIFFLVIFSLLVPPQTIMVPLFSRFRFFYGGYNLIGTYFPSIVLASTGLGIKNGLFIFMFRQFFINMPKELEDAAYVDGCNTFRTFYKIMLPSAVALMVTIFLFSFSWQWTDTVYTNLFMRGTNLLSNAISAVTAGDDEVMNTAYNNTAAVLSVLPIGLIYIIGQKFFIQSVERSGITG